MSENTMNCNPDINIALLRGINVGGKNKLPMKELAALFADAGCDEVRTYIQSGNVLFRTGSADVEEISAIISASIRNRYGYQVPVVTRTGQELQEIVKANPFLAAGAEADKLHVMFLAELPDSDSVEALDPARSPGDEFAVQGREIYLHCPNGVARSKLTNSYFDSKLSTTSTSRNWRTVRKLLELAADAGN
ncbi:MAG: DUF1697 domain-containing protein [Caldilineaceae bacterium SB0670_bin_27]|uniref:DUF1697 domain-containing protein n=1 Tax=Caldilineaceae bacterium SB0664_bin_27 TaxID=2605260 RepID=A0A6B0YPY9_9CHLR|nr:DUF1697 domain-containing protein [Caldilineaceae bacterium SB0664_bin_27]MYJ76939.1 DUF1697 domain-containing protein [Caldilineaceae bacterium SB0670_bin_27]